MGAVPWKVLLLVVAGVAGCTVDAVTFSQHPLENCELEGDEDGNGVSECDDEACAEVPACQSTCGNNATERGEQCDEGGVSTMTCDANCTAPGCGDGFFNPMAEACDEGRNTRSCDSDCTHARCGDSFVNTAANEECDAAGGMTAQCDLDCTLPKCNDGQLNPLVGEEKEPPSSLSTTVPVNSQTCRYDFSAMTQMYCSGTCGTWGGGNGCQQEDADAFCKLKTGNATSTAMSFALAVATAQPGICCPSAMAPGCVLLGPFPGRGVNVNVYIHDTSILASHGSGQVVTNVVCTN